MQNYIYGRDRGDEWIVTVATLLSLVLYALLLQVADMWHAALFAVLGALLSAFALALARRRVSDVLTHIYRKGRIDS